MKIKDKKAHMRGDLTFFLTNSRKLTMTPEDRSEKVMKLSKLELWLLLREVKDSRVDNDEIIVVFNEVGIELMEVSNG
jgi:hypothetical protein